MRYYLIKYPPGSLSPAAGLSRPGFTDYHFMIIIL